VLVAGGTAPVCAQGGTRLGAQPATAGAAWLEAWDGGAPPVVALADRYGPPAGFTREAAEPGGFAAWLRRLPVRLDRNAVYSYRGREVAAPAAAVFALDLGEGDLQQCADTIIRLHAEYLWATGRAAAAAYHFTSGDRTAFSDWVRGERFAVSGSRVRRLDGPPRAADHASYRAWLQNLFLYAGTLSMRLDSRPVEVVRAGDFFVLPGSPGHAVIVLDVAADAEGRRVALVGQGYTPAQDFHLLGDVRPDVLDGVWFPLPDGEGEALRLPGWSPFPRAAARRFSEAGGP
jgi:hypothetical protein